MENANNKKGSFKGLLPLVIFLVVYFAMGIGTGDFGNFPLMIGIFLASAISLFMNSPVAEKKTFTEKVVMFCKGGGDDTLILMVIIYMLAGAFYGVASGMHATDTVTNIGISILPANMILPGLFLIGCVLSFSMGTSMGTVAALMPIAINIADKTGVGVALVSGIVVGGAMFGDNLSFISDTTIAAVKTQGCEMKDKFKANFFIVLPAAIITVLIFWFVTRNMNFHLEENLSYSLWEVLPYMVVLLGALIGINVFVVLISGIVISLIVGVSMGHIALSEMFQVVGNGVTSMYDITVISIIVACIVSLVKEHGGIQFILNLIKSKINGRRGAEFGIALLALFVDACTANNTVAIVMTGPIAKEISEEFDVDPRRSASLLDMFTSVGQGIIPYGAQLLSAATLTGLTPLQIIPNLYYPLLMGVCGVLAIIFRPQSKKLQ